MSGLSKIKTGGLHTGCVSAEAIARIETLETKIATLEAK